MKRKKAILKQLHVPFRFKLSSSIMFPFLNKYTSFILIKLHELQAFPSLMKQANEVFGYGYSSEERA
jgi:hypothetical protein